ncbi:hypothetical protein EYF80_010392 [Liparis tanakae]|uniref:Uncharacterized protein n=1 Tax=Liparis tanakae TaxID=230148 RepID=A0A4Z2INY6_9TELE|nr:hypothetical protein EYF80_010392 [Liparis tanakae]
MALNGSQNGRGELASQSGSEYYTKSADGANSLYLRGIQRYTPGCPSDLCTPLIFHLPNNTFPLLLHFLGQLCLLIFLLLDRLCLFLFYLLHPTCPLCAHLLHPTCILCAYLLHPTCLLCAYLLHPTCLLCAYLLHPTCGHKAQQSIQDLSPPSLLSYSFVSFKMH